MEGQSARRSWETDTQVRRRRRTWIWYVGFALVVLAGLGLAAVASLFLYWRSLVQTYTTTTPEPLPAVRGTEMDRTALLARWSLFYENVRQGVPTPPFEIGADEINLLLAADPQMRDRLRIELTNGSVFGRFTFPLAQSGQQELANRHLNGRARLHLDFTDGWLTLTVAEMEANGRPIPKWLLRRLQRENLLRDLDRQPEMLEFLRQLAAIEVVGDRLILRPAVTEP